MDFLKLVQGSRSCRRFDGAAALTGEALRSLVDVARFAPTGGNRQPLKFYACCDPALNARIFPLLKWAGYLTDWEGPAERERPAGYVVVLADADIAGASSCDTDAGIAAQTIALAAASQGLGACMLGAFSREKLSAALALPDRLRPLLVIALGVPAETVRIVDVDAGGSIRYYRDQRQVHYVPKRTLDELLVGPLGKP